MITDLPHRPFRDRSSAIFGVAYGGFSGNAWRLEVIAQYNDIRTAGCADLTQLAVLGPALDAALEDPDPCQERQQRTRMFRKLTRARQRAGNDS